VPEGDTIGRAAGRLRPVLEGAGLARFVAPRVPRPHPHVGERIEEVAARGKHLLVSFERGLVLRTHLGMTGSWHLYRRSEPWRKPRYLARVVVGVDGWEAVCFSAPTVRLETTPSVGHLGPDLCRPDADLEECVRRMDLIDPSTPVVDVLLDQRVCCGVGNVFKSEVCFACRLHPLTALIELDAAARLELVETASRQLRAALRSGTRTTVAGPPGRLAVYGRGRRPCRRCGAPIASRRLGAHARGTYWCPRCQLR
jgi:endonuclease VIII